MLSQKTSTDVMNKLAEVKGVSAVAVIARDGFPIETAGAFHNIDIDALGATVATMLDAAEETGKDLEISPFSKAMIEYQGAVLLIVPVGDAVAAIISPDDKSLGMVRFKAKKFLPELAVFF